MKEIVYVKADSNTTVYDKKLSIGDALQVICADIAIMRNIKQKELYRFNHEHAAVFSIMKVISLIQEEYPNVQIINCGEEDFVVEYVKDTVKSPIKEKLKLIVISIIVFFGSAFTIMTFHNDIGIEKVFERFYVQLMGMDKPMVTELEVSYSIGLAVGMIVFFNHFSKKKITHDPTPIEVEMKKYNMDLINTKIADSEEKGHKIDVT